MKFLLPLTFSVAMGAAFAQDPPAPLPQQQQSTDSITIVGCLTKGTMEGQYTIADSKTAQNISFAASQPMDAYLNHTVQITGTMTDNGSGSKSFTPQTIRTVADTCGGQSDDSRR